MSPETEPNIPPSESPATEVHAAQHTVVETPSHSKEHKTAQKIEQLFPEVLVGEKGQVVKEALVVLQEVGKLSLEEIRGLAHTIVYAEEDQKIVPEGGQAPDADEELFFLAGMQDGKLFLFPKFFTEASPDKQAHIIAHEIGESMQRKRLPPQEGTRGKQETLVDYIAYLELFASRSQDYNDAYVQIQFKKGYDDRYHEALADDIGDYLTSSTPLEWVAQRATRLPEQQRESLGLALESHRQGEPVEPGSLLDAFITEAEKVYAFLGSQLNDAKDGKSKRDRLKEVLSNSDEAGGDEDWLSYSQAPGGDIHGLTTAKVDTKAIDNFYDRLFGVKPLIGG